jgi:hypothetical protein
MVIWTHRRLKKFRDYLNKNYLFNSKLVNIKVAITEMYPWIPLGAGRGSVGIGGAHFGKQCICRWRQPNLTNKVVENRHKILRAVNSKVYNECEPSNSFEQDIMHPNNCYQNSPDMTVLRIKNAKAKLQSVYPEFITKCFRRCVCDLHLTCR